MKLIKLLTAVFSLSLIFCSCNDDLDPAEKYQRPDWLAGKVYTQVKDNPDLSVFANALELTGYDTIIDVSGSYTVFAPNNEAFTLYFQENPLYNSLEDIPAEELLRLVKFHIVQNPWSKLQLMSLDVYGWIDSTDQTNDEPRGFKRETLLLEEDAKFGVIYPDGSSKPVIVDTLQSEWHRRVFRDSRKFAPIFFRDYMNIYDLTSDDYEFYFNRSMGGSNDLHFAGAQVIGNEIFAENGFVYTIDRVVEPLLNAYQFLSSGEGDKSYNHFREMVNYFPDFEYNEEKTYDQPGADLGLEVDSLFDLNFPELAFDLTNEKTSPPSGTFGLPGNVTIRYHHGMLAPTDEAMEAFENEYFIGANKWGSLVRAPKNIRRIILNSHLSVSSVYKSDLSKGFYNGELDLVTVDESSIVEKQFGSNSTIIGLNEAIVPRAFSSVTGPVYLQRGYSTAMNAIESAGLLSALKRENQEYMLFVESDANCKEDSSLLFDSFRNRFSAFILTPVSQQQVFIDTDALRTLLLNHIGTRQPRGLARKEFVKNLAGNYIIINNVTGEVSGTRNTTDGYKGLTSNPIYPTPISENADNGITYDIEDWFSWSAATLYNKISTDFPAFHNLLSDAGLALPREYRYSFISESEIYTVFIPSEQAIMDFQMDTLSNEELRSLLLLHFIQGEMIFTDGNRSPGYYETVRVDEKTTEFTTYYTRIFVEPDIDFIHLPESSGTGNFVSIEESENSNILTGRNLGEGNEAFPKLINNAVIHQIEKVLVKDLLDTD